ncbi:MAG: recombinase family protein, partial [Clostridia bacterium]
QNGKKLWQIHEPEAKRIRLAFQMASQGQNYRRILMALNKMETAEGTGVRWLQPRVYQMLQSEVYRGDVLTNKSYRVDYLSTRLMKNEGQRDQYYIEDHHAAIIDKATFEQVGELIRQGALRTKDRGKCGK